MTMAANAQLNNKAISFVPNVARLVQLRLSRLNRRSIHIGDHFTKGSLKEIELRTPVPLAGRKYLPSSVTAGFPKLLSGPREDYPLLLKAKNPHDTTLKDWAKRCREVIDQAYNKYDQDGSPVAILFRGLPVTNQKDFSIWSSNLGYESFAYVGGTAPRNEIAENVAEGSLDDKEYTIEPHSEMGYSVRYPKIFTMCTFKTATWGGETAMCDVREVHAKLDPSFVEKCKSKQIRYWHFVPDEKSKQNGRIYQSWQMQFMTEDRSKVEEYLNEHDYSYAWEDGNLSYWNDLPPFIRHARSGEKLWFNHLTTSHYTYFASLPRYEGVDLPNKYLFHTTYGDGEEIEQRFIDEQRRITWDSAVGFQWNNGDVLFIDQLIVQHSRLGFDGERKVGISLLSY